MTTPQIYSPKPPSILDTLGYTKRVADAILRNNPLTDAVISEGLMKWIGNYVSGGGPAKINFLWIGEFSPLDTNLPGSPPQRGFSLVRDDSRGGVSAVALYDSNPGAGGGLKQNLRVTSGDGNQLYTEHRDGGVRWPESNVYMGPLWSDVLLWPSAQGSSFSTVYEGRANIVGNTLAYRVFCATTGGATGEFKLVVAAPGGDVDGPVHSLGANAQSVFDSTMSVSTWRGQTLPVHWKVRRTNGVGDVRAAVISVRCFTP